MEFVTEVSSWGGVGDRSWMCEDMTATRADAGFAGDGHVPTVPPDFLTPNLALFQARSLVQGSTRMIMQS